MPIKYKRVETFNLVPDEKKCNKCREVFRETIDDMVGWQEFFHVKFQGGFGSVLGDEAEVEINLCQKCLKELLGSYLEIGPD
jgi:hypothetical protein